MKKCTLVTGMAAAAMLMLSITAAQAVPRLRLTDGTTVIDVVGGLNGVATYNGAVGQDWIVNVTTGISDPTLGSEARPHMDLNSVNVSAYSTSGGTLTISLTDDGYTPVPGGSPSASWSSFVHHIGGTTGGSIAASVYAGSAPFDMSTPLTSQTFSTPSFSGTAGASGLGLSDPFSLTMTAAITHGTGTAITSFDSELKVPDGGSTVMLLGSALAALGLFVRSRRS